MIEEKTFPFEFRNEREFNALEKILDAREVSKRFHSVKKIVEAYEDCGGNAIEASRETGYSSITIRKYWRIAEFGIKEVGQPVSSDEICDIIGAYYVFDGNASEASKELNFSAPTFIKYWKMVGLKIRKRGPSINTKTYQEHQRLIELGNNQNEIARELKVTRQAVSAYIEYHPELRQIYGGQRGKTKK